MDRREFLALTGAAGVATAFPRLGIAQANIPHVAWLSTPLDPGFLQALKQGLSDNGYADGTGVIIDVFTAAANADLPASAAKAVAGRPVVLVAFGTAGVQAAKAATATLPIVFLNVSDPIGSGVVPSIARPGGNISGVTAFQPELIGKQLAMLKEIQPPLRRVAIPVFPADALTALWTPPLQAAAKPLGIELQFISFIEGQDYVGQFERVFASDVQGIFHLPFTQFGNFRDQLFDLYVRSRMPVLSVQPVLPGTSTPSTGVVTYAANTPGNIRSRGAAIVVAILKGAKPADLPVEVANIFDVVVNTDWANKIGVTIPPSILAQATLVIDYDIRAPKAVAK